MRMPFGKYKGVELTEVPRPYLRWLRGQEWLDGWPAQAIDDLRTGDEAPPEETLEEALQRWREGHKRK
jgi:diadenosine tetraphosphatase ApaH/serine/threonine PP2A family protein phosphatase